jgi:hypothetical protein
MTCELFLEYFFVGSLGQTALRFESSTDRLFSDINQVIDANALTLLQ